ncbi:hypothetical protein GIB67_038830 [Kingdonia uniflora]|uniref:Uncharacterized protein n=1 Tax=Kingdonia uniflora TaxID=39325 RepID=A0A7J7M0S9_9MAGN|nr:hypothetical protein GIB67_038830 [Kingdonia uniflora]
MEYSSSVKVLERCKISPPPGSVLQQSLPLTFFDIRILGSPPVKRLFYYEIPLSKTEFMDSVLPNIKHSLSLTLQHFFPLVGSLIWSPQSSKPEILYVDGDSISFTVAESNLNFNYVSGNHPRDVNMLYPLIPQLLSASDAIVPQLALQVTLFPSSVECRANLDPALPENYFGNRIVRCFTATNKEDLLQEDGVVVAAEIIGEGIQNLRAKGVLDRFQNDLATYFSILPQNLSIAVGHQSSEFMRPILDGEGQRRSKSLQSTSPKSYLLVNAVMEKSVSRSD